MEQWRLGCRNTVPPIARAGIRFTRHRRDDPVRCYPPHPVIAGVGDVESPIRSDGYPLGGIERCLQSRSAIPAEVGGPNTSHSGNQPISSYFANAVVAGVGDIKAPVGSHRNPMGQVQLRLIGWTIVAAVAAGPVSGHGIDDPIHSDPPDPVIASISNIKAAVRSHGHAARALQSCLNSWAAVPAITRTSVARHGGDGALELFSPLNRAPPAIPEIKHSAGRLISVVHP